MHTEDGHAGDGANSVRSAPEADVLETSVAAVLAQVLADVLDDADALRCRNAVRVELAELPLPALRRRRTLLQEEARRLQHWSRLVRARLDLLVASACGPEELQVPVEAACHGGPLELHLAGGAVVVEPAAGLAADALPPLPGSAPDEHALDPAHGLRGLLLLDRPSGSGSLPEQLNELTVAQRRLTEYGKALLAELAVATDVLAERCRAVFGQSR